MCDAAGPSEERWDRETEVYYCQFPGCEIGGVRGRYTEFGIENSTEMQSLFKSIVLFKGASEIRLEETQT